MIDKEFFKGLEKDFDTSIASRINLNIIETGELSKLLAWRLKGWCDQYYKGLFEIGNFTFPKRVNVIFTDKETAIHIEVDDGEQKEKLTPISRTMSFPAQPPTNAQ